MKGKKGWHNESRRHSLASKGIKTAQRVKIIPLGDTAILKEKVIEKKDKTVIQLELKKQHKWRNARDLILDKLRKHKKSEIYKNLSEKQKKKYDKILKDISKIKKGEELKTAVKLHKKTFAELGVLASVIPASIIFPALFTAFAVGAVATAGYTAYDVKTRTGKMLDEYQKTLNQIRKDLPDLPAWEQRRIAEKVQFRKHQKRKR